MKRRLATLVLLAATTPLAAQWLTLSTPGIPRTADGEPDLSAPAPRAADGHPDLSGLWVPLEVEGDLLDPTRLQESVRTLMAEREARFFEADPRFSCLPSGPGFLTLTGTLVGLRRIVQNPAVIAILNADLSYRQIFTDGRELEPDPLPTWTGYSVGRWDGDTLVVESNGYNDKTWLHTRGLSHTESLRITERYLRSDFGHIQVDVTYDDPGMFDSPLHALIRMEFVADDEMLETVCNESSKGRSHWGGEISEADEKVVDVAPEILARYVGTYEGYWLRRPIAVEVTVEDGALFLLRTPPYTRNANTETEKSRLVALSDTAFECSCGLAFVFTAEDGAMATEVSEVHVSGGWPFRRVP
ncbi:hypothetical protein [Candidatus Rariloculus sp.]|uniref:hypothetical protein n=1 Tax=Candidatus Rariloculus sp. TaxID=3101265 RepID=UPI003D1415A8